MRNPRRKVSAIIESVCANFVVVDTWSDDEDTAVPNKVISRRSTTKSAKSRILF